MGYKRNVQQRDYVPKKDRIMKGVSENSWKPLLYTSGKFSPAQYLRQ